MLHVGSDYEIIAEVTGQPVRRLLDPKRDHAARPQTPAVTSQRKTRADRICCLKILHELAVRQVHIIRSVFGLTVCLAGSVIGKAV